MSGKFPARLIVFDLLQFGNARLTEKPLSERREALKAFVRAAGQHRVLVLSRATRTAATARRWLAEEKGLDGIVAKRLDQPYRPGERTMRKYKVWHTVDAVLAGYYEDEATRTIDSLLFGLYGDDGLLHFVGHSRVYDDAAEIARLLAPLKGGTGFTGRAPGGKSRWTGKTQKMVRLNPSAGGGAFSRSHFRRPVPARLAADPLAHRQGAARLHDRSARALERAVIPEAFAICRGTFRPPASLTNAALHIAPRPSPRC